MQREKTDYNFEFKSLPKKDKAHTYKNWKFTQQGKIIQKSMNKELCKSYLEAIEELSITDEQLPQDLTDDFQSLSISIYQGLRAALDQDKDYETLSTKLRTKNPQRCGRLAWIMLDKELFQHKQMMVMQARKDWDILRATSLREADAFVTKAEELRAIIESAEKVGNYEMYEKLTEKTSSLKSDPLMAVRLAKFQEIYLGHAQVRR